MEKDFNSDFFTLVFFYMYEEIMFLFDFYTISFINYCNIFVWDID